MIATILRNNESGPGGATNTLQGLTRSLDLTKEGLGMNPTRICAVDGCDERHHAKGMCSTHYHKSKRPTYYWATTEERFWSRVGQRSADECWEWQGGKFPDGYGVFRAVLQGQKIQRAHRYSLAAKLGRPIRQGLVACHTCDNRGCVNPNHLYEGTHKDNSRDMVEHGNHARGERMSARVGKLTEAEAMEIRRLCRAGMSGRQLGERFGISGNYALRIGQGKAWAYASDIFNAQEGEK